MQGAETDWTRRHFGLRSNLNTQVCRRALWNANLPSPKDLELCDGLVIVPAALFAADSGVAMVYSNGNTWLKRQQPSKIVRHLFRVISRYQHRASVAKINASGSSSLIVLSDSLVQFEGNAVKLGTEA